MVMSNCEPLSNVNGITHDLVQQSLVMQKCHDPVFMYLKMHYPGMFFISVHILSGHTCVVLCLRNLGCNSKE